MEAVGLAQEKPEPQVMVLMVAQVALLANLVLRPHEVLQLKITMAHPQMDIVLTFMVLVL
jgi:hypothetical protein